MYWLMRTFAHVTLCTLCQMMMAQSVTVGVIENTLQNESEANINQLLVDEVGELLEEEFEVSF